MHNNSTQTYKQSHLILEDIKVVKRKVSQGQIRIDLVTVFDAILTSRKTCEKLQCLYENLMSNNFR